MSAAIDLAERYARMVLTDEWESTQSLARRAGVEWHPGGHELRPFRAALYRLQVRGEAVQMTRHNGHLWRRVTAPERAAMKDRAAFERMCSGGSR